MPAHPIDSYLRQARKRQAKFAREVRCSDSLLSMIIRRQRRPSPDLAKRIQRRSGGAVTMEQLYSVRLKRREAA